MRRSLFAAVALLSAALSFPAAAQTVDGSKVRVGGTPLPDVLDGKASTSGGTLSGSLRVPAGTSSGPGIQFARVTTGIYEATPHHMAFATQCQDSTAPHCWGPMIFADTGNLILGSPVPTAADPTFAQNHPGLTIHVNDHNGDNTGSRVPIQIMNYTHLSNAIEPYISWRSRCAWEDIRDGTATNCAVQERDVLLLLQGQGETRNTPPFNGGNHVGGNLQLRVFPGVTIADGQETVPSQWLFTTVRADTLLNSTDLTIGQGKLNLLTSSLAIGGIAYPIVYPSATANRADAEFQNLKVSGTFTPAAAFGVPSAGNGEVGYYVPRELAATNLLLQSATLASPWAFTSATATANGTAISPDGTADANDLTSSAAGGYVSQIVAVPASSSTIYLASVYVSTASTATQYTVQIALCGASSTCVGATTYSAIYNVGVDRTACTSDPGSSCKIAPVGAWQRVRVAATNNGSTYVRVRIYANGGFGAAATSTIYAPQLEAAPAGATLTDVAATSAILTGASAVTRPAGVIATQLSGRTWLQSNGSPEGVVTAAVGALYTRSDGGAGTTLYVKESGTGNTGWVAK